MKRKQSAAARVHLAQAELAAAECELTKSAQPWRRHLQKHRSTLTLVSGFATGLALAIFPPRWWASAGAAVGAIAASTARSALTPVIIGAVLSQALRSEDVSQTPAPSTEIE